MNLKYIFRDYWLWRSSPYKKGEIVHSYGESVRVKVVDIDRFTHSCMHFFPFEYLVEYPDGKTKWVKGHNLVAVTYPGRNRIAEKGLKPSNADRILSNENNLLA